SRAVTTYFIINLAFADLLTGIFAIPFKFQAALFQEWFLPNSLCQIVPYAETVSLSVSVFTLTASAVHEFRTVFLPKHWRLNTRNARFLVVLIWLVAALVSLPHGLFHRVYLIEDGDLIIAQCRPVYADESWWKIYNVYLTIIHYFVPMVILDTAYTMIAIKIWTSTVSTGEESQNLNNQNNLNTEISNRKLIYMLMIVVACFSLCWFPLESYLLLNEIKPEINGWKYINVLFFCSHWLAMSNSCLNPIIYGLYNNKYKREYQRVLSRIRCHSVDESVGEGFKFSTECSQEVCYVEIIFLDQYYRFVIIIEDHRGSPEKSSKEVNPELMANS
ncbi:7 transmembrane receptor, partial [Necator americanus]